MELRKRWRESLIGSLEGFDGREVADHNGTLRWARRKLIVKLPITKSPETIAKAMNDLINMTKDAVTNRLNEIR